MIEEIGNSDLSILLPSDNPVSIMVNNTLTKIKTQEIEDKFGWLVSAE